MTEVSVKFEDLGLSKSSLAAVQKKGFEIASPIQAATIPLLLQNEFDMIGQAQTGTGKTAAFGLPILDLVDPKAKHSQALILVPTRELAIQVSEEIMTYRGDRSISVISVYGGQAMGLQMKKIDMGCTIVVGTPGRVMDLIERKKLDFTKISHFVLDEADEMLNMGFIDDITRVLARVNPAARKLFFSATMPQEILDVAGDYMGDYQIVSIKKDQLTTTNTEQLYFEVNERDKFEALTRIIDIESDFYGIVFCKTKIDCGQIASHLQDRGYDAEAIHGDVEQKDRERTLKRFKAKKLTILVATDVAARGIDVNDLTHVINYSLPQDAESYVHRIGRTGRAGKKGIAITFVTPGEYRQLIYVKKATKTDIKKAEVPGADSVVAAKKARLKDGIDALLVTGVDENYKTLATDIMGERDAKDVVAALLRYAYEHDFDPAQYQELSNIASIDKTGKSRLFVALGRDGGYGPKELVDYLVRETGVAATNINDVRVMGGFSFVTLGFEDAEHMLYHFASGKKGGRSLVSRAKEKNDDEKSGGDRRPRPAGNRGGFRRR